MSSFYTGGTHSKALNWLLYIAIAVSPLALTSCKDGGREFRKVLRGAARDVGHSRPANRASTSESGTKKQKQSKKKRQKSADEIQSCPDGARIYGAAPPRGIAQWCHAPDKNGKAIRHGEYRRWHKNGKLKTVAEYKKGALDGTRVQWYPTGKKRSENNFLGGERHGPWVEYGKDGAKRFEGAYHNGIEHGRFTRWNRHGQMKSQGNFSDGAKSGLWVNYNSNGSLKSKIVYANGKKEGVVETYSRKGTLDKREVYRNDIPHGSFVSFWSDGNKKLVGLFNKGQKEGQWVTYDKSGNVKSSVVYKNGAKSFVAPQVASTQSSRSRSISKRRTRRSRRTSFGKGDILGAPRPIRRKRETSPLISEQTAVSPPQQKSNGGWKSF